MAMPRRSRLRLTTISALLALGLLALGSSPAMAGTRDLKWLIVRCRPANVPAIRYTTDYYRNMFTTAGDGTANMVDFWKDVSFGQLSIAGSVVADGPHADRDGWYVEPDTENTLITFTRGEQVAACAEEAAQDYNLSDFYGVISLWPGVDTTITGDIYPGQTSIPIALSGAITPNTSAMNDFPTTPFGMLIDAGSSAETVTVTAVHQTTLTIQRGQNVIPATPPATGYVDNVPLSFNSGAEIQTLNDTSYGAASEGQASVTLNTPDGHGSGTFNLALVNLPSNVNESGAAHEMGHGMGLEHSRRISTPTAGYFNFYDTMSVFASDSATEPFGPQNVEYGGANLLDSPYASKGPGLDAVQLQNLGVLPSSRIKQVPQSQDTFPIHSLTDPDALSDSPSDRALEAQLPTGHDGIRVPFTAAVPATGTTAATPEVFCTASHYTLEYRESTGPWDSGIPAEHDYWLPKSATLNAAPKAADFPNGSVVLDLPCKEPAAQSSGTVDYDYDWLVDTAPPSTNAALTHNGDLYGDEYANRSPNADAPGTFWPGDEFQDPRDGIYFAVNEDLQSPREAFVTTSNAPIRDTFTDIGPGSASLDGSVTLTATLRVKLPGSQADADDAVVPGHLVTFTLGTQTCSSETGLNGKASCTLVVRGQLGDVKLSVRAPSTRAYASATGSTTSDVRLTLLHPVHFPTLLPNPVRHGPRPVPPRPGTGI
jgi:hypothetical protein